MPKTCVGAVASRARSPYSLAGRGSEPSAHRHAARGQVDDDLARLEHVAIRAGRTGATQDGPDPGEQLVVVERAREVVVTAPVERPNAVDSIGLGVPEDDDGHAAIPRATRLALAKPAAHVELGGEEHEVGAHALGELECVLLVVGADDVEAVIREMALEEAADALLGLRQEQGLRHATTVAASPDAVEVSFRANL